MNEETVNKSISFLFCDFLIKQQTMNWFSKQQLIYQTWPVYATHYEYLTFCCPFDLFTLFLPFPFPGFEYFADGGEFALPLRRRGVLCGGTQCGWLHLAILFLVWKKKIKHSQQSILVYHNFPADVIFYTVPDCNSKSIPCVGKWPANANSGFNNQGTML